jgi:hypothetical protein
MRRARGTAADDDATADDAAATALAPAAAATVAGAVCITVADAALAVSPWRTR